MLPEARWAGLLLAVLAILPGVDAVPVVVPSQLVLSEDQAPATLQVSGLAPRPGAVTSATLQLLVSVVDAGVVSASVTAFDPAAGEATIAVQPRADAYGATQVVLTLIDPLGVVAGAVVPVSVSAVNDPPRSAAWWVLTMGDLQYIGLNRLTFRYEDPDGDEVTYTLVTLPQYGQVFSTYGPLALGDVFTQTDIDRNRIGYLTSSAVAVIDEFYVTVDDGHAPTASGWETKGIGIFVGGSPAVPAILTLTSGEPTWTEGGAPVAVCDQAEVFDEDSPSLKGGRMIARIAAGAALGDRLSLVTTGYSATDIGISGGTVSYGGVPIGSATGGDGSPLEVEFTSDDASPLAAGALLRALRFSGSGDDPGPTLRQVELVVDDGSAGSSPGAVVPVQVVPVNDPPVATLPGGIGLVAGSERIVTIPAADPDSAQLNWTLVQAPAFVTATIPDAQHGEINLAAPAGMHGNGELVVAVSDGLAPAVEVRIPLAVGAPGDPAPHPAGEFPGQLFRGDLLDLDLPFDCSEIPGAVLEFSLSGEVPAGLVLSAGGAQTAHIHWVVPGDLLPGHYRFLILATDQATLATGVLPVMVPVRLPLGGGG